MLDFYLGVVFFLMCIWGLVCAFSIQERPSKTTLARLVGSVILVPVWPLTLLVGLGFGAWWTVRTLRQDPWLEKIPWRKKEPQDRG